MPKSQKPSCCLDEIHRARLHAELNTYYARLYGLTRDELRYTLRVDPKEVYGEDPSTRLRAAFPWRDIPRAEGEGSQSVGWPLLCSGRRTSANYL